MTPYYEQDGITIHNCDFRDERLQPIIYKADLIVADPPYGETSLKWDCWPRNWPDHIGRCANPNASMWCFGSSRMFWDHRGEFDHWRFVQDLVWEKHNGSSFVNDRFKRVHEAVFQFVLLGSKWADVYKNPVMVPEARAKVIRNKRRLCHLGAIGTGKYVSEDGGPKMMRSVVYARSCHGYAVNETQKPEAIVLPILQYSCPLGGLVFSPFMGSGTDLVVARALGMQAVGCDVREEQCEAAALRLSQGVLDLSEVSA